MEILPSIDVRAGVPVLRMRGAERPAEPGVEALAERYLAAGATTLHLVDLDAAFGGAASNGPIIARIASTGLAVQAAGLRRREDVLGALDAGASRAALSAGVLGEREHVASLAAELGDALVVAIDVTGGRLAARGGGGPDESLPDALAWLEETAAVRYAVTAVGREGSGEGPDLALLAEVRRATSRPVALGGGIGTVADVEAVARGGAEAVIVGSALHGGLDLGAAIAAASGDM